ncbi:MAG: hypothetical protein WD063_21795 [Pirellulales bacterium]
MTVAAIAAASIVAHASPLVAIETTYGEDPVPNTQCYKGFINLGYGIDPIPSKTLSQRWHEWRTGRGIAAAMVRVPRVACPPVPSALRGKQTVAPGE